WFVGHAGQYELRVAQEFQCLRYAVEDDRPSAVDSLVVRVEQALAAQEVLLGRTAVNVVRQRTMYQYLDALADEGYDALHRQGLEAEIGAHRVRSRGQIWHGVQQRAVQVNQYRAHGIATHGRVAAHAWCRLGAFFTYRLSFNSRDRQTRESAERQYLTPAAAASL